MDEFNISQISFFHDLEKLPKTDLQDIAADMGLFEKDSTEDLVSQIWGQLSYSKQQKEDKLKNYQNKLLCGRTSAEWYTAEKNNASNKINSEELSALCGFKSKIIAFAKFDPFNEMNIPDVDELTTIPILISAAKGCKEGQYYLRFIYKTRNIRNVYANQISLIPHSKIATVLVDESNNCVEIRADKQFASKIARELAKITSNDISFEKVNLAKKFSSSVEKIAEKINGTVKGTASKPSLSCIAVSDDECNVLVETLKNINDFFLSGLDTSNFIKNLEKLKEQNSELLEKTQFIDLLLSGLEKVGLDTSSDDLKVNPLYALLKPFVTNQEGIINFSINENGLMSDYSIRIGFLRNSIFFITPATEESFQFVREKLILS